jgi:hypothetical protein
MRKFVLSGRVYEKCELMFVHYNKVLQKYISTHVLWDTKKMLGSRSRTHVKIDNYLLKMLLSVYCHRVRNVNEIKMECW